MVRLKEAMKCILSLIGGQESAVLVTREGCASWSLGSVPAALPAPGGFEPILRILGCVPPVSASVSSWLTPLLSLLRDELLDLGPIRVIQADLIPEPELHLQKQLFQIRSIHRSWVVGCGPLGR